jgi:NAD(P)H dehydrogenase (quinone)
VQQVDDGTYRQILVGAGIPDFVAAMYADIQRGIREGQLDVESGDLERLLGRPLTPLADVLATALPGTR